MKICKKCLMLSTRPRLEFDNNGVCAACEWEEIKKTIDFEERKLELTKLCDEIRNKNKFDCIVPVSGGKDSTYVAHKMKYEYGLRVLTVTVTPPLETSIIQENLNSFLAIGGFDNIKVTPNPKIMKEINKKGLIEQGRPLLGWTTCLNTTMLQLATSLNVPLIMFGEEGESEYGGSKKLRYSAYYNVSDSIELYTYGNNPADYASYFPKNELTMFQYPSQDEILNSKTKVAHWSYFENWDTNKHYIFAKENYNMRERQEQSVGTYTNFSQMDTPLYDLHAYFMYLKFGFGRCLQDSCIDIRKGRISREEAVELVNKYDGEFPSTYIDCYLSYFDISRDEFQEILVKHTNNDLFLWKDDKLVRKFTIE